MSHLLNNEFYKIRKAKYFWICILINIALAVGTIFILDFTYKIAGDQMEAQMSGQQDAMDEAGVNISTSGIPTSYDDLCASTQLIGFFTGNTPLLLAVVISLLVGSEFNNGTIKNIASKNHSRTKIYLSKLIASVIVGIIFVLIHVLFSTITATAVWGFGDISAGYWPTVIKSGGIELLLISAFVSVFVMISMLIRQNGGSLAANICFLEFFSLVVMLGEVILKKLLDMKVVLSNYLLDTNMNAVAADLTKTVAIRSITVGLAFFLIAALIGISSFQRRDIK